MQEYRYFFFILSAYFLVGCSTSENSAPSNDTLDEYRVNISKNPKYLKEIDITSLPSHERQALIFISAKYFLEKKNLKASCQRFKYLSRDKSFFLKQLALIYSLKVCKYNEYQLDSIWNKYNYTVKPYYKKFYLQQSLYYSKFHKRPDRLAYFTKQLIPYLDTNKEKELILEESISSLYSWNPQYKVQPSLKELIAIREKLIPRTIKKPKKDNFMDVAESFLKNRNFDKARFYFKKIIHDKSHFLSVRIKAYEKLSFSYKLQRNKEAYAQNLRKAVRWLKNILIKKKYKTKLKAKEILQTESLLSIKLARALWTISRDKEAKKWLNILLKRDSLSDETYATSYLILGSIELENKQNEKSRELFRKGLSFREISDDTQEHIGWSLVWSYYLQEEWQKTIDLIDDLLERTSKIPFKNKLTFWKAKILKKIKRENESENLFSVLAKENPYDYYGIIASMEAGVPLRLPQKKSFDYEESPYPIFNWLVSLQEFEYAQNYLNEIQKNFKSPLDIKKLLPYYHSALWYEGGIAKYFSLDAKKRKSIEEDSLPAIFPAPYYSKFDKVSQIMKVPKEFIYSIARQESAFNPKVRSWADAFGLLQVTPEKAKILAKKLRISYQGFEDLYDVEKNLYLGTFLLKQLSRKFKGQFIPTVIAYNAGERPLKVWLNERYRSDPLEFIENIPYKETRTYIKLVLRNLSSYRRIFKKSWQEDMEFFSKDLLTF